VTLPNADWRLAIEASGGKPAFRTAIWWETKAASSRRTPKKEISVDSRGKTQAGKTLLAGASSSALQARNVTAWANGPGRTSSKLAGAPLALCRVLKKRTGTKIRTDTNACPTLLKLKFATLQLLELTSKLRVTVGRQGCRQEWRQDRCPRCAGCHSRRSTGDSLGRNHARSLHEKPVTKRS